MEGISGSAAHIIILKPASAKAVLLIRVVQECSARGQNLRDRVKRRAASVKPANFTGSSGLKGNISACRTKNLNLPRKPEFSLKLQKGS